MPPVVLQIIFPSPSVAAVEIPNRAFLTTDESLITNIPWLVEGICDKFLLPQTSMPLHILKHAFVKVALSNINVALGSTMIFPMGGNLTVVCMVNVAGAL